MKEFFCCFSSRNNDLSRSGIPTGAVISRTNRMKARRFVILEAILVFLLVFGSVSVRFAATSSLAEAPSVSDSELAARKILLSPESLDIPDSVFGTPIFTGKDIKAKSVKNGVFNLPFATDKKAERFYFDEKVDLDLSGSPMFYLTLTFDKQEDVQAPNLYFHSGNGWFSMSGRAIVKLDGRTVRCEYNSSAATLEDKPAGLDKVDIIRIGCWRTGNNDFSFEIGAFYHGLPARIGVLHTNATHETSQFAGLMGKMLQNAGLSGAKIMQNQISKDLLKRYKAVIIPIGGGITPETIDLLCDYLDHGGFIMTFYTSNARLMKKMGFRGGEYVRCSKETVEVSKIVFTPEFVRYFSPYLPKEMDQASFNFTWAVPLEKTEDPFLQKRANAPRIAGWWYDDQGNKTKYPAVLWSGRGIYFSHVLMSDDLPKKEKFLQAILNVYDPQGRQMLFCRKWRELFEIGLVPKNGFKSILDKRSPEIFMKLKERGWTAEKIVDLYQSLFPKAETITQNASTDNAAKAFSKISSLRLIALLDAIEEVRAELVHDYLVKMPEQKTEARFWWEHSGTGPYPGDWDKTMKELSQNGFNGVIANMAWGGTAYYNSDLLPRHEKVAKYGDQIALFAAAGKKYGVETHIWKVNFNCSNAPKIFIDQLAKEGRLQKNRSGKQGEKGWLCPSNPKNKDLEVAVMLEIATKYDITGIHFDYIRYPDQEHCYCEGCQARFSDYYFEKTGKKIDWNDQNKKGKLWSAVVANDEKILPLFIQWRADQITDVVRRTREAVDKLNRKVLISAAVFQGYPGTIKSVGQDWGLWCRKGYLDFACPMNYTDQPANFAGMIDRQLDAVQNVCPIYPGIGATVPSQLSPDKVAEQIEITRNKKTGGFCIFDLSKRTVKSVVPAFEGTPFAKKSQVRSENK